MAKDKTMYVCSNCGYDSAKWLGKCPSCGEWSSFKEIKVTNDSGANAAKNAAMSIRRGSASLVATAQSSTHNKPIKLRDISAKDEPRINTYDHELNRVLGGGIVPGSIILLGGEPGIGKSTLTLQTILRMSDKRILYVSGEESAHQIKMRAERLGQIDPDAIFVLCETSLENIFAHCFGRFFARQRHTGTRMRGFALALCQDQWRAGHPYRTYQQGGHIGRTEDSRTYRRYRHSV